MRRALERRPRAWTLVELGVDLRQLDPRQPAQRDRPGAPETRQKAVELAGCSCFGRTRGYGHVWFFLIASPAVNAPYRIARAATLLVCCACARPTEVELRLHACALAGEAPVRVDLEIRGLDAEGAVLPVLEASFDIDPAALADGYATVALRKPVGMVEADFTISWHDGDGGIEVVELLGRPVPAPGEVLELAADDCTPVGESSGGSSTSGDGTTGGSSTTDGTTAVESTSTGGDTTSMTSMTSMTSSSTDETDATTDGTTGEASMVGTVCDGMFQFYCENGGPGQVGTMLYCDGVWKDDDLEEICATLFKANCPDTLGMVNPVAVGCSGVGPGGLTCVWKDTPGQPCEPVGCTLGKKITLCDDGDRVLAECSGPCEVVDSEPLCGE